MLQFLCVLVNWLVTEPSAWDLIYSSFHTEMVIQTAHLLVTKQHSSPERRSRVEDLERSLVDELIVLNNGMKYEEVTLQVKIPLSQLISSHLILSHLKCTLLETNMALKMDSWKMSLSFSGGLFSGAMLVLGWVYFLYISTYFPTKFHPHLVFFGSSSVVFPD